MSRPLLYASACLVAACVGSDPQVQVQRSGTDGREEQPGGRGTNPGAVLPDGDRLPDGGSSGATDGGGVDVSDGGIPDDRAIVAVEPRLQALDIAIVQDTTGSMWKQVEQLQSAMAGRLLSDLTAQVPGVQVAIVEHKDFGVLEHGSPGDFPVRVLQTMTSDPTLLRTAVGKLVVFGGGDGPESQIPAMNYALTGAEIAWTGGRVAAHSPPAGRWGGVDFREGVLPLVVLVTDIDWHDTGNSPYSFPAPTTATTLPAFTSRGAKFVAISNVLAQANRLSDATASNVPVTAFAGACGGQCCTGHGLSAAPPTGPAGSCRLNYSVEASDASDDSSFAITSAVTALSRSPLFAEVRAEIVSTGAPAEHVRALRAVDEGNVANGCARAVAIDKDGDGIRETLVAPPLRARACFEVITNTGTRAPQTYTVAIRIVGSPGDVELARADVVYKSTAP